MYPKFSTYRLHLQSQLTVYVLIFLLNTERDSDAFMSAGSVLQSFCPRNRIVSVPNLIVLTFGKHMFPPSLNSYEGTVVNQSAKKCEMTSFSMTSLPVDVNEAAKCVDTIPSHTSTRYKMATILGLTYEDSLTIVRKLEASKHEKNSPFVFNSW